MQTFRSNETMFEGEDLGEAHPLELDLNPVNAPAPVNVPSIPLLQPPAPLSTYVPPTRLASSNPLLTLLADIPMTIWKRVAVYPFALWLIIWLLLPCRLSNGATLVLFTLGTIGIAGAWIRYRAHDRFLTTFS